MGDLPFIIRVIDDDVSFVAAVSRLLREVGYEVRTYSSAGHFLLEHADDAPGCILLDVNMPGPSGLELQAALAERRLRLPIVFLTAFAQVSDSVLAMKAGAIDFLIKPIEREPLLSAIQHACETEARWRQLRIAEAKKYALFETLTARERLVLLGVVAGKLNKQIASDLGVAERTVKAQRANVMKKLGVRTGAELATFVTQLRSSSPATAG
jgi:FixJ family two-component response regulator